MKPQLAVAAPGDAVAAEVGDVVAAMDEAAIGERTVRPSLSLTVHRLHIMHLSIFHAMST
jgi:hypothetical protein